MEFTHPCSVPALTGLPTDQEQLLFAVVSEIEVFGALDPSLVHATFDPLMVGLRTIGVPYQPSLWFGRLGEARRQALSRATRRLCRRGFVERVTAASRDRVTHLRPTLAALQYVEMRALGSLDRAVLLEGLRRCRWATELSCQFAMLSTTTNAPVSSAVSRTSPDWGVTNRQNLTESDAEKDTSAAFDFVLAPIEL